jgi:hypothetical protein
MNNTYIAIGLMLLIPILLTSIIIAAIFLYTVIETVVIGICAGFNKAIGFFKR